MRALRIIIGTVCLVAALPPAVIATLGCSRGAIHGLADLGAVLSFLISSVSLGAIGYLILKGQRPPISKKAKILVSAGVLVGLAGFCASVPIYIRARTTTASAACFYNLKLIESAKEQWALENHKKRGDRVTLADLQPYLGRGPEGKMPTCLRGGHYYLGSVGEPPKCSLDWGGENPH